MRVFGAEAGAEAGAAAGAERTEAEEVGEGGGGGCAGRLGGLAGVLFRHPPLRRGPGFLGGGGLAVVLVGDWVVPESRDLHPGDAATSGLTMLT